MSTMRELDTLFLRETGIGQPESGIGQRRLYVCIV